ncbi:hypothetical protein TBLA_0J00490 [Henningerozyma blattae CBS 6284]|uniref:Ribonuclease T2-like n=1 Tax=Henningerozyma blattae (strain ATCC 34711 / CBS 6284 / DSM 70876 / NBRC 10599 / NRRL Y-10934 / UCD 77-7) TaxID=1071380 RepID=I2H9J7_HENB6|nr:hypothetical protein TBLA_0J00490 [Tetrapisispora blattae CBS 6284]CCH63049.1 hypothetical protein TBLA_0J00490 [Tetrapisispora blattae CBS 6284]
MLVSNLANILFSLRDTNTDPQVTFQDKNLIPNVIANATCPIEIPLSCHNNTFVEDSCCFEYPGGIFLQTQFWDYQPSRKGLNKTEIEKELGPLDSFTIHGLWPDNCDGTYEQFCDQSLMIDDVSNLLNSKQFNDPNSNNDISGKELLHLLNTYWKSDRNDDESLWIHEFNKHGSCISSLKPKCYDRWNSQYQQDKDDSFKQYKKQAVFDYFKTTYNLFKKLDTFEILASNNIVPSIDKSYTLKEITDALSKEFDNKKVLISCDNKNSLKEIWYFNLISGSLLNEKFIPIDSLDSKFSNCKPTNIKFYPKGYFPKHSKPQPPDKTLPRLRGIIRLSGFNGFLIRNGHWYNRGTPANFELITSPFGNYYLKSRNGYCGINGLKKLVCNKSYNNAVQFEYDSKTGHLGYSNIFDWGSTSYPSGNKQSDVFLGDEYTYNYKLKFLRFP